MISVQVGLQSDYDGSIPTATATDSDGLAMSQSPRAKVSARSQPVLGADMLVKSSSERAEVGRYDVNSGKFIEVSYLTY